VDAIVHGDEFGLGAPELVHDLVDIGHARSRQPVHLEDVDAAHQAIAHVGTKAVQRWSREKASPAALLLMPQIDVVAPEPGSLLDGELLAQ
jgi:hypothetical protein